MDLNQESNKKIARIDEMKGKISSLESPGEKKEKRKTPITPQLFTAREAAIYIGMSEYWLAVARKKNPEDLKRVEGAGYIPRPKHAQLSVRRIRYLRSALDEWIQTQSGAKE